MSDEAKNLWDVVLALLAMVGATIAFGLGLYQWRKGQDWQRAAKGRELVDDLLESDDSDEEYYAWDAMKMLDYADDKRPLLTKRIVGRRHPIGSKDVQAALADTSGDSDKLTYIRECFDELYFKLGQFQDAIDNDLVELKHVSCPIDYYAGLMAEDVKMHHDYMDEYGYQRALKFLENFNDWKQARQKAKLPDPGVRKNKPL